MPTEHDEIYIEYIQANVRVDELIDTIHVLIDPDSTWEYGDEPTYVMDIIFGLHDFTKQNKRGYKVLKEIIGLLFSDYCANPEKYSGDNDRVDLFQAMRSIGYDPDCDGMAKVTDIARYELKMSGVEAAVMIREAEENWREVKVGIEFVGLGMDQCIPLWQIDSLIDNWNLFKFGIVIQREPEPEKVVFELD